MTELAEDPRAVARRRVRPGPAAVALRPLGYLGIGVVWCVVLLVAVLVLVGSVAYVLTDDQLVEGIRDRFSTPGGVAGEVLVIIPILTVVMGPVAAWQLPTASWPLMVLSFTFAVRSVRPSYAAEKLSYTSTAPAGTSFGPPTTSDLAMSLQPLRRSRFTDAVMRFYVAGWTLDGAMFVAMLPAGLAWTTVVVGLFPGLSRPVHVAFLALSVVLVLASVVLGVRAFRRRFPAVPRGGLADEPAGGAA
ncbi:hypothetical protein ACFT5B_05795 [Luteimicrobium sp. NPDC057192]|uniref:hypothetical protein n=1 Tax=Luteimicrobium sp. NPDC057192 TaxID=3346042 RepID=UPI0036329173